MADQVDRPARECGDDDVVAGRGPGQIGWYEWIARTHVQGCTVLDAGCGLGYGLQILARSAAQVHGQDMDPRLASERVRIGPISTLPSKAFDVVVSVDVVEHIQDDAAFVADLVRVARKTVVMTTPNWTAGRCVWPYHIREYTPKQLRDLCSPFGSVRMWKGTPDGYDVHPIAHPAWNDLLNRTRALPVTAPFVRALNIVLPTPSKIHSHLAVAIDLTGR